MKNAVAGDSENKRLERLREPETRRIREQRAELAQKLEQASERLDDAPMVTVESTFELAKRVKLR